MFTFPLSPSRCATRFIVPVLSDAFIPSGVADTVVFMTEVLYSCTKEQNNER